MAADGLEEAAKPFEMPGTFYLDGHAKQRVYILSGKDLVIVRVGENRRGWDEAALPNAAIRALKAPSSATPQPQAKSGMHRAKFERACITWVSVCRG
jgi:hypothetical protein